MMLPGSFLDNMKCLLGDEFPAFLDSYNMPVNRGLRTNRLKISGDEFYGTMPFNIEKIPYIDNGFIYNKENPAKDAYYHAGLYYLQEPSAMLPANRLPVDKGDKVIDLCAAPGGKATELLGKLDGTGFLYANDISASRAQALLKNIEMTGADNYYVTAESPESLADRLCEFFDKVLCDVPCSGEGMFRKDAALIATYEKCVIKDYQGIQRGILSSAYKLLKPGGMLMYSTCTFNTLENEENIEWFMGEHSDMELMDIDGFECFSKGFLGLDKCVRVFPHKMSGEGHFLALMKKSGEDSCRPEQSFKGDKDNIGNKHNKGNRSQTDYNCTKFGACETLKIGKSVFKLPDLPDNGYRKGLRYLRTGLYIGDETNTKSGDAAINYSQAYAMTLKYNEDGFSYVNLRHDDVRVNKYLKGETIFLNEDENTEKGYTVIMTDGFPLGFAKSDGYKLKNMYNPSWRMK